MQLTHDTTSFKKQKFPIIVLCENVTNAPNIGSLFRICDAFGIQEIVFNGDESSIISRKMKKTSRATEKYVSYKFITNIEAYLLEMKQQNQIIALEITNNSKSIQKQKFDFSSPIILVIGDENFGVSENTLKHCNEVIHIDMFGENSSMNVVQAANFALYEITKQCQDINKW
ncbi:TrmH family RNA methyltransferase [Flavobacterium gelidilacus]|uniref:TrmH family RNA methyltransferase n=1 Tax=Flavobacterium gelidilacus TaxID=206041 RepID=UPI0003F600CD|nr:TrmH family RNA methyltransferase [Flavobacterium gelidilacus]